MSFSDEDLERLKNKCEATDEIQISVYRWNTLQLLARLEAAEAYRACAIHLLEALVSYKKYTPFPYKQNPIYIIGSTEAEKEFKRIEYTWHKAASK